MNSVIIAEPDEEIREALALAIGAAGSVTRQVDGLDTVAGLASSGELDLLVVGPSLVDDAALGIAQKLRSIDDAAVILVPIEVDTELMRRALRAGVHDVVAVEHAASELSESAARALAAVRDARSHGEIIAAPCAPEPPAARARVITVFSTKGGVGKTVVSTNLAAALAKAGNNVIVLDLDLQFGDVGVMLGLEPVHTIFDAVQHYERLDTAMLEALLVPHASGARALLAPIRPEDAEAVTATRITGIVELLRSMTDYLVIDTSPSLSDVTLTALDEADIAYVLTMMDIASIKNTRISIQKLQQLGYRQELLRIVLNRADSKVFLGVKDVEEAIGAPVTLRIPSDLVVPRSVNRGVPVIIDAPRSKVARSLQELAQDAARIAEGGDADVA